MPDEIVYDEMKFGIGQTVPRSRPLPGDQRNPQRTGRGWRGASRVAGNAGSGVDRDRSGEADIRFCSPRLDGRSRHQ